MLIDTHIHVGQFCDEYYSPSVISRLMTDVEVDFYAVSSTTTCEENYKKVLCELHELIQLDGEKVLPIMWITPEGLKGNIAWFLESNIKWRCIKVHPFLHQNDWSPMGSQFAEVIDIARELHLPLLIHTGNETCCMASKYESLVTLNPDITFILAHGRPQESTMRLVSQYSNVYADSAFMPVPYMKEFVDKRLSEKLLWGTDMCMPKHFYHNINLSDYYTKKLTSFRTVCSPRQFEIVTHINATSIFNLNKLK